VRRLVPIVVVAVPLVVAQHVYSADPLSAPLGVVMCVAFFLLAPVSWRALFHEDEPVGRTFAEPFGRVVVYGVAGAGTVWIVGTLLPAALGMGPTFLTSSTSLMVSTALFWVGGYGLGRDIDLEHSLAQARARADTMAQEAERAQLLALRSHLDPHFLFNTLNAIAEWCREDGETAERATLQLSSMLRTIMAATRLRTWSLQRELELCGTLLELHLIRDPGLFELERDAPEPLPDVEVPPMVLLPLVENAVKHGPSAGHRGQLRLRVRADEEIVRIELDNPGAFAGPRPGGEGIDLVRKRLAHAYVGDASFEIAAVGERTVAVVVIPRRIPEVNT
jgi:signal transduction histidine kinase